MKLWSGRANHWLAICVYIARLGDIYLALFTLEKVDLATYMNFPLQGNLRFELGSGS